MGRVNDHPHPPPPKAIRAGQVRGEMKYRARTTLEKTQDIISGGDAGEDDNVLENLPSARTMQQDIQQQRQKAKNLPRVPNDGDFAFVIPKKY